MTRFNHTPRSGRRKRPKQRARKGLGHLTIDQLVAHRELEFIRHPTRERYFKLQQAKRGKDA
jgi:hypothetical protein